MYSVFGTHTVADGGRAEGTWRFNYSQYFNTSFANFSSTMAWNNLFGWGRSGWNNDAFSNSSDGDLTGPYAYADWGVYNAILNGGNQPQQWRTLSYDEWDYLLNQRRGYSVKWGIANINGYYGLILLPDSWSLPTGIDFNEGAALSGTVLNRYSTQQWKQMEEAGAVFLYDGFNYWTSTRYSGNRAYQLYISDYTSSGVGLTNDGSSRTSVRLVKDVN